MSNKPPVVFDNDNPEWTKADFARAKPALELFGAEFVEQNLVRQRGRPAKPESERKQHVNLRLSPEVLAALRATGQGWQTRVDLLLRQGLGLS